ncbi:MAG: hypothetical protein BGO07_01855 [Alphaproteobacteria bacterium 40-19]|mgnify:CR=1 FL=1|nr:MAG: hypothetical protein BGO07_01855 [Alphaproteobacteria bacterium 40-19]
MKKKLTRLFLIFCIIPRVQAADYPALPAHQPTKLYKPLTLFTNTPTLPNFTTFNIDGTNKPFYEKSRRTLGENMPYDRIENHAKTQTQYTVAIPSLDSTNNEVIHETKEKMIPLDVQGDGACLLRSVGLSPDEFYNIAKPLVRRLHTQYLSGNNDLFIEIHGILNLFQGIELNNIDLSKHQDVSRNGRIYAVKPEFFDEIINNWDDYIDQVKDLIAEEGIGAQSLPKGLTIQGKKIYYLGVIPSPSEAPHLYKEIAKRKGIYIRSFSNDFAGKPNVVVLRNEFGKAQDPHLNIVTLGGSAGSLGSGIGGHYQQLLTVGDPVPKILIEEYNAWGGGSPNKIHIRNLKNSKSDPHSLSGRSLFSRLLGNHFSSSPSLSDATKSPDPIITDSKISDPLINSKVSDPIMTDSKAPSSLNQPPAESAKNPTGTAFIDAVKKSLNEIKKKNSEREFLELITRKCTDPSDYICSIMEEISKKTADKKRKKSKGRKRNARRKTSRSQQLIDTLKTYLQSNPTAAEMVPENFLSNLSDQLGVREKKKSKNRRRRR